MVKPIPIICRDNAGTGFLVSDGDTVWLVTCVHIFSELINTPPEASFFMNAEVRVVGDSLSIPLYVANQKRFSVVVNTTTGCLVDIIAIKLSEFEANKLADFGAYSVKSISTPEVGEKVSATGFPIVNGTMPGASTTEAIIEQVHGVSIRLSEASAGGLSGSAVVQEDRLLGVIHGDVGTKSNMTSALAVTIEVVASVLFK